MVRVSCLLLLFMLYFVIFLVVCLFSVLFCFVFCFIIYVRSLNLLLVCSLSSVVGLVLVLVMCRCMIHLIQPVTEMMVLGGSDETEFSLYVE